jgi:hypothetical protein
MTYSGTAWTATDFITGLNGPVGLAIDGGSLYVSQFGAYNIWAYSLADASAQWGFSTNSSPQYFTITSIPEPATVSILGLGMLGLLRRKRN